MKDIAKQVRSDRDKQSENLRLVFDTIADRLETGRDASGNPMNYSEFAQWLVNFANSFGSDVQSELALKSIAFKILAKLDSEGRLDSDGKYLLVFLKQVIRE